MKPFIAAMIIPTGIGCKIGGHAGDATPAARLLAGACDTLLVHPNVVNAADINEMPNNSLYVEGSMLDRFLQGEISLRSIRSNRILVVCNKITPSTVNCVETARVLLGAQVELLQLERPLRMKSYVTDIKAGGHVDGIDELYGQIKNMHFDALAIHTEIDLEPGVEEQYLEKGGINPWGGVEAIASRQISRALNVPAAHAPVETNMSYNEVVFPALAPELISGSMLFCVLKGLHKAPRIADYKDGLNVSDLDALVSPMCWGMPHHECKKANVPIIMVKNNTTETGLKIPNSEIEVSSYLEAAGALIALREGISHASLNRPLIPVELENET